MQNDSCFISLNAMSLKEDKIRIQKYFDFLCYKLCLCYAFLKKLINSDDTKYTEIEICVEKAKLLKPTYNFTTYSSSFYFLYFTGSLENKGTILPRRKFSFLLSVYWQKWFLLFWHSLAKWNLLWSLSDCPPLTSYVRSKKTKYW